MPDMINLTLNNSATGAAGPSAHSGILEKPGDSLDQHGIQVAAWNFASVREPFVITSFIVILAVVKIAYHHSRFVARHVPESCILILIGTIIGGLMFLGPYAEIVGFLKFHETSFFLFLLPPIVLESAYSLRDSAFVKNLGPILLYAVVGTILNTVIIGPFLFALYMLGFMGPMSPSLRLLDCLVFSSLIAAVDPVAVLAIFQEVGVNKSLYFLVFGESLLNDAVTIVLYRLMVGFLEMPEKIGAREVGLGIAAFLATSVGAISIGAACGLLTAFLTKYTSKMRAIEPVVLYGLGYMSYLLAEMFHFSGIISMICCGFLQCQYAADNVSPRSFLTITNFAKAASVVTESLIFIILGVMLFHEGQEWQTGFVIWSVVLCLFIRFAVTFGLTYMVNRFQDKRHQIGWREQIIIGYGGLRGAIAFSLVFMIKDSLVPLKPMLLTTTFVIILFTVFVQGTSMKPLVKTLDIQADKKADISLFKELNDWVEDQTTLGMEEIIGHRGLHYFSELCKKINRALLRPAVQKFPHVQGSRLLMAYQQLALHNSLPNGLGTQKRTKLLLLDQSLMPSSFVEHFMDAEQSLRQKASSCTELLDDNAELIKARDTMRNAGREPVNFSYRHVLPSTADIAGMTTSNSQFNLLRLLTVMEARQKLRRRGSRESIRSAERRDSLTLTSTSLKRTSVKFELHHEPSISNGHALTGSQDASDNCLTLAVPSVVNDDVLHRDSSYVSPRFEVGVLEDVIEEVNECSIHSNSAEAIRLKQLVKSHGEVRKSISLPKITEV